MAEISLDQALDLARQYLAQGRRSEAGSLCRQILATQPNAVPALELLGMLAAQEGRAAEALGLYAQVVRLQPAYAEAHATLGSLLSVLGRPTDAVAHFQEALRHKPALTDVHYHLGNVLLNIGRDNEAEACYRTAIQLLPRHAETRNNLGVIFKKRGALEDAQACFQEAITLRPNFAEAYSNLGATLELLHRYADALECHLRAVNLQAANPDMLFRLGVTLAALARHEEAVDAFTRVLALQPNHGDALNNSGISLRMLGRIDDAAAAFRRATACRPADAPAWSNLGVVLDLKGERREALDCYRHAVEADPLNAAAHGNLLYSLHFHPEISPEKLLEEHRVWDQRHALPLRREILPHANSREPDRRLRIGYVSPDFRDHPVGRFMAPLIGAHDPAAVEVFCYADVPVFDRIAQEIATRCHHWRVLNGMSDAQVAALIRDDQIDILVDLTMHMSGNRLLVFARKPAPVQATYLAYCSTTGLATMDYRLTDPYLDPPESDLSVYTERTVRVPRYWCYSPGVEAPAVNALPAEGCGGGGGGVTFGCLNGFNKVSEDALATWGRLLAAVPGSRLLLHANPGSHRDRVWRMLAEMGVAAQRCEFVGLGRLTEYFQTYHRIDLALDPFPYAGGTTTCDALWMGVPVVTLRGERAVGRGGVSILSSLGLEQWIARTPAEYVEIAAALARDREKLATWRQNLREHMQFSPLMDSAKFARSMEAAYRQMWRDYCGSGAGIPCAAYSFRSTP